jgi:hypothetical protein
MTRIDVSAQTVFDDEVLTPGELACRLKCSVRTVYREQADGVLPGRLVRGALRFYWPEVVRALPAAGGAAARVAQDRLRGVDLVTLLKQRVRLARRA